MTIDLETVARIATLSRLKIPQQDHPQVAKELNGILNWIAMLNEVDVSSVEPMAAVNEMPMRRRDDVVNDGGDPKGILANAPGKTEGFFTVPKVVE